LSHTISRIMKKLLHLLFLCTLLPGAYAQNNTCGSISPEIIPTENTIELCEGTVTPEQTINLSSNLPYTAFFVIDLEQMADDEQGSAIVGISDNGIFIPRSFGLTHDKQFAIRPFSYDTYGFGNWVDFILNNSSADMTCCEELEDIAKEFCDNLAFEGIYSGDDVNDLNDIFKILKFLGGNTGDSYSINGFLQGINNLSLNTLPEDCQYNTDYCYALGDNEQVFKVLEAPQIVEVMVDTPHEITINSIISDGLLEYSIDPNGDWQTDNTIIDTPSEGVAYVRESITQCIEEKTFNNANLNVELAEFKATAEATTNLLYWVTATEINNLGFGIERSADGVNFSQIAWVDGAGNSQIPLDYVYRDMSPLAGQSYYRLIMEDTNGRIEDSDKVTVQRKDGTGFSILSIGPNPSANIINVSIVNNEPGEVQYFIYDVMGRKARDGNQNLLVGINNFTIDATVMGTGMYVFTAFKDDYVVSAYKFVMH